MQNITKKLIPVTVGLEDTFQGVLLRLGGPETDSKANTLRSPD